MVPADSFSKDLTVNACSFNNFTTSVASLRAPGNCVKKPFRSGSPTTSAVLSGTESIFKRLSVVTICLIMPALIHTGSASLLLSCNNSQGKPAVYLSSTQTIFPCFFSRFLKSFGISSSNIALAFSSVQLLSVEISCIKSSTIPVQV